MKTFKNILILAVSLLIIACGKDDEPQNTAPQIENQEFTVAEDIDETVLIGNLQATDADNDVLTYNITINDDDLFVLTETGELSLAVDKTLNYDIAQSHTVTVDVADGINTTTITVTINITNVANVYIAGLEERVAEQVQRGILWKDGKNITPSVMLNNSFTIISMDVFGSDIYAISNKVFYKNNTAVTTGIITSEHGGGFSSIDVASNGDVYIAGFGSKVTTLAIAGVAKIWKNGEAMPPLLGTNGDNISSYAHDVFISGTDVYAVGIILNTATTTHKVVVWKNGSLHAEIFSGNGLFNDTYPVLNFSIFVKNEAIYVAGAETNGNKNIAKVWKNGEATILGAGSEDSYATALFVTDNNEVYVLGREGENNNRRIKAWKNGAPLNNFESPNEKAFEGGIAVFNDDVYISGRIKNPDPTISISGVAVVWKNGELTIIGETSSDANNIGIVTTPTCIVVK